MPNLSEIASSWLKSNGYGGLCEASGECGCALGDLMPCDNPNLDCQAGYKEDADPSTGYDFVITPGKRKEDQNDK